MQTILIELDKIAAATGRSWKRGLLSACLLIALLLPLLFGGSTFVHAEGEDASSPSPSIETPATAETPAEVAPSSQPTPSQEQTSEGAVIVTGDASAEIELENLLNTNITATPPREVDPAGAILPEANSTDAADLSPQSTETSGTPAAEVQNEPLASTGPSPLSLTAENANTATADNAVGGDAATGTNSASSGGGAIIDTGDAQAGTNIINVLNTNAVAGDLTILTGNSSSSTEAIDLSLASSTMSDAVALGDGPCPGGCSASTSISVENSNVASVTNTVVLRANTGDNVASSTNCQDASISTGNAYAAANIINFLNTNLLGSHLVVAAINQLGDWTGDLILPAQSFFDQFFSSNAAASTPSGVNVINDNTATILDNITLGAETGKNTASGDNALIQTGTASALSNTLTIANTNILDAGSSLHILINVAGTWTGTVFSMPPGMIWSSENGRIELTDEQTRTTALTPLSSVMSGAVASSTNTNDATITNTLLIEAATGANTAESRCGQSAILTGDARALANVVNFANTNVIGKNWFLALINIAGNWQGNIAFGRPDLWIGTHADLSASEPLNYGERITYTFTATNKGDADATDAVITDRFDEQLLSVIDSGGGLVTHPGRIDWHVGAIPAGSSVTRSYAVEISDSLPLGRTLFTNRSQVLAHEPDSDPANNHDAITISAEYVSRVQSRRPPTNTDGISSGSNLPDLVITKTSDAVGPITASSTVNYTLHITYTGNDPIYDATVFDSISGPDGSIIGTSHWDLGAVYPGEEINISYGMNFSSTSPPGIYTNSAYIQYHRDSGGFLGESEIARSHVTITATAPELSGSATASTATMRTNESVGVLAAPQTSSHPDDVAERVDMERTQNIDSGLSLLGNLRALFALPIVRAATQSSTPQAGENSERGLAALFAGLPFTKNSLTAILIITILATVAVRMIEEQQRVRKNARNRS